MCIRDRTYTTAGACPGTATAMVTILTTPVLDAVADVTACGSFTLPTTITGTNLTTTPRFYTATGGPGGTGTVLAPGAVINTTQTVFIYDEITGMSGVTCSDEESFMVTIEQAPIANTVPNQVVCDDTSNDGEEEFDLTALESTILGTQLAADFTITFHNDQADADTNTDAITPTTAVTLMDNDSVFCLLYTSPSPRDRTRSRMPSSA